MTEWNREFFLTSVTLRGVTEVFSFLQYLFIADEVGVPPLCKGRCHLRQQMTEGLSLII